MRITAGVHLPKARLWTNVLAVIISREIVLTAPENGDIWTYDNRA